MTFAPGMVVLGPAEGQRVNMMGNLHINKAVHADTNGAWTLVEQHIIGANPPLQQHDREDEAWYVLQGRVRVRVGDTEIDGEPGSFSWHHAVCRTRSRGSQVMTSSCCSLSRRWTGANILTRWRTCLKRTRQNPSVLDGIGVHYGSTGAWFTASSKNCSRSPDIHTTRMITTSVY